MSGLANSNQICFLFFCLCFLRFYLGPEPLVEDVKHLPAQVAKEERQGPLTHALALVGGRKKSLLF